MKRLTLLTLLLILMSALPAATRTIYKGPMLPPCNDTAQNLCLNEGRFGVAVDWYDFHGNSGVGRALEYRAADSGIFWFFNDDNWEMLVKVLDGCAINGHYWVFSAATTNVGYTLYVSDTLTGVRLQYTNPLGVSSPAITDTFAFDTCLGAATGDQCLSGETCFEGSGIFHVPTVEYPLHEIETTAKNPAETPVPAP
ncbi:MAG: hypothetical protein GY835_08770 [bacterium]|nr:hypothetical protein [bacterium]